LSRDDIYIDFYVRKLKTFYLQINTSAFFD